MSRTEQLQAELTSKKVKTESIVELMLEDNALVDQVFHELSSRISRVKFGCAKSLMVLSEAHPDVLYPSIGKVVDLLGSENRILRWNGIIMLGNLAAVDEERRIGRVLPKLFGFISGGELITANNTIIALGKIGRAFPEQQGRIASQLLQIENAVFPTDECRNIAIGKTILALGMFIEPAKAGREILDFVESQTGNRRKATAEKAKLFLRKARKAGAV